MNSEPETAPPNRLMLLTCLLVPLLAALAAAAWYGGKSFVVLQGVQLELSSNELYGVYFWSGYAKVPFFVLAGVTLGLLHARWVVGVGFLALFTATTLLFVGGLAGNPNIYMGVFTLFMTLGAGAHALTSVSLVTLATLNFRNNQPLLLTLLLSLFYISLNIGAFLSPAVGSLIMEPLGVTWAFLLPMWCAGFGLLLAAGYTFLSTRVPQSARVSGSDSKTTFRTTRLFLGLIALVLFSPAIGMYWLLWERFVSAIPLDLAPLHTSLMYGGTGVMMATGLLLAGLSGACHAMQRSFSPWWIFSAGALLWAISCSVPLSTAWTPGLYSIWAFTVLGSMGELLIAVGFWAGLTQGQHWRAVGPLVGAAMFGTYLLQLLPGLLDWLKPMLDSTLFEVVVCINLVLITLGGLGMVLAYRFESSAVALEDEGVPVADSTVPSPNDAER